MRATHWRSAPPPLRPRRRRGGLGGAPARHPHLHPVPPGAGNRQRQQRQERHGIPRQRDVPPRQASLRRGAHGLRLPALRRSGRTRRRVRPRALLRVRHAVPVPRVPGRRGQEARRRLRHPRPARWRLDGRLLRVLRRHQPVLAQLRWLPRARHHRRQRACHQLVVRAAEPHRLGLARQSVRAGDTCCWGLVAWRDGVAGAIVGFDCYLRFDVAVATATVTSTAPARVPPLRRLGEQSTLHSSSSSYCAGVENILI